MTRFTLPAAVFLFLIRDGKVLMIRRQNTGWCDGDYDLIAGHIDGDEHFSTALIREAKEEAGITIHPEDVEFVNLTHCLAEDGGKEYIYVSFKVTRWQGEPTICEPDVCDDMTWFPLDNPPKNITPGSKAVLEACATGSAYTEITA
jgi:8-oxo-dGTP pyrophosphatase MutT (NUDIX family)